MLFWLFARSREVRSEQELGVRESLTVLLQSEFTA
jgi:hypothetical protein